MMLSRLHYYYHSIGGDYGIVSCVFKTSLSNICLLPACHMSDVCCEYWTKLDAVLLHYYIIVVTSACTIGVVETCTSSLNCYYDHQWCCLYCWIRVSRRIPASFGQFVRSNRSVRIHVGDSQVKTRFTMTQCSIILYRGLD